MKSSSIPSKTQKNKQNKSQKRWKNYSASGLNSTQFETSTTQSPGEFPTFTSLPLTLPTSNQPINGLSSFTSTCSKELLKRQFQANKIGAITLLISSRFSSTSPSAEVFLRKTKPSFRFWSIWKSWCLRAAFRIQSWDSWWLEGHGANLVIPFHRV